MGLKNFLNKLFFPDDRREEPREAKIIHSFNATVADELTVSRGSVVRAMYREDDWLYVEGPDGRRGFVPHHYCSILPPKPQPPTAKKSGRARDVQRLARRPTAENTHTWNRTCMQKFLDSLPDRKEEGEDFPTMPLGMATMIYPFLAGAPGDISVAANQQVCVLNASDPNWLYVRDKEGSVGFVPTEYLDYDGPISTVDKFSEQKLLVVEDFAARNPLDISISRGEWVLGVYDENSTWTWVQSERGDGFVPSRALLIATDL